MTTTPDRANRHSQWVPPATPATNFARRREAGRSTQPPTARDHRSHTVRGGTSRAAKCPTRGNRPGKAARSYVRSNRAIDERLRLADERVEVRCVLEALGVDFVDVLG